MSDLTNLFDVANQKPDPKRRGWPLRWGAATAAERGPVITSRDPALRNAIGTHAGGYGVYRALAIAARTSGMSIWARVTAMVGRMSSPRASSSRNTSPTR